VQIQKHVGHIENDPPIFPEGEEVGQGELLKKPKVKVDYSIISRGKEVVLPQLRFENLVKLGTVGADLIYRHKIWNCSSPDLLEGLRCQAPIDQPPGRQRLGYPFLWFVYFF
jgi:hypothetical protein